MKVVNFAIVLGCLCTWAAEAQSPDDRPSNTPATMQTQNVRSGPAVVRGTLSREVIQRVVRSHLRETRNCYERALSANPSLQGRVVIRFIISPRGGVQAAVAQEVAAGFEEVSRCLQTAIRRWTFPEPPGGGSGIVIVNYPFDFGPG